MNVAIIAPEYAPFTNWGGVATFNSNLAKLLSRLGHRVVVFTLRNDSNGLESRFENIKVLKVPWKFNNRVLDFLYFRIPFGYLRKVLQKYFPTTLFIVEWNLFSLRFFSKKQRKARIDFIHAPVQNCPTILISLLHKNKPTILHSQGPLSQLIKYDRQTLDQGIASFLETIYMRSAARVVVSCTEHVQHYLSEKIPSLRNAIVYIPNFVDISLFKASKQDIDLNTLLFVGRLEYRKGPDLLLQSYIQLAKKYPKLKIIFVGVDESCTWRDSNVTFKKWMEQFSLPEQIAKRILFVKRIDNRKKLVAFLKKHRGITIVPSRYEPFGFVIIEAMAAGSVVVSSKRGGGAEIITHGFNGFLIEPSINAIHDAVIEIRRMDRKKLSLIVRNARDTVRQRYSLVGVAPKYKKLYHRVVAN